MIQTKFKISPVLWMVSSYAKQQVKFQKVQLKFKSRFQVIKSL